jgi:hypothetical protein
MFNNSKRIKELQRDLEQLKFDLTRPQKYQVGDKLKDGTVIISAEKDYRLMFGNLVSIEYSHKVYDWVYKGVKKGSIITLY